MIKTDILPGIDSGLLKEKTVINLRTYLTSQSISAKLIEEIAGPIFINKNPSYYTYYPYLTRHLKLIVLKCLINYR